MWLFWFLSGCTGTTLDERSESTTLVSMPLPENGYQVVTPRYEVPAYSEVEICSVMRLEPHGSERLVWTNRLESLVTEGTHHMNVLIGQFSFLDALMGEGASENALGASVGQYPCSELSTMGVAYTVFPSQRTNQVVTLPEGVAAPLTTPLMLVFSHHYVNATDSPIDINAVLNVETMDAENVDSVANLIFDDIPDIEIEPGTDRVFDRTCIVDRDIQIALVSTHNHAWGACATMNHYSGSTGTVDPEPFFVNKQWDRPPILHFEPDSFSIRAGDGIHWACHYRNDTEQTLINDGTAEGEMCVFAAVSYPSLWSVEEVEQTVADGELEPLFTLLSDAIGPCDSTLEDVVSPWNPDDADGCEAWSQTESNSLE